MKFRISKDEKNIFINMLGAFAVKGGSLVISVLLLPAYINFFDNQTMLGVWYTILSVLNWVGLFDLGLGNGLRNKLPSVIEKGDRLGVRKYISTTYIAMVVIALLVCVAGLVIIPFVNWNSVLNVSAELISGKDLASCISIVFFGIMLQLVLKIIIAILYALQRSAIVNALMLASNTIILIAVLLLPSYDLATNLRNMSWVNVLATTVPYIVCTIVLFATSLKDAKPSPRFFEKDFVKDVLGIGITLLWLSLVFMVITAANELLITKLTSPDNVVYYQAYNKIFNTGAMIITLALTPIWSAVTKAQAKNDYPWIKKIYKLFLFATGGCFIIELCIIPFLQVIMNVWLREDAIAVDPRYALAFAVLSTIMILHNVNTSIGNGMSYFRLQTVWMTIAAALFIPVSYVLVQLLNSWIGIIISAVICVLPYEILAPIYTMKKLKNLISTAEKNSIKE